VDQQRVADADRLDERDLDRAAAIVLVLAQRQLTPPVDLEDPHGNPDVAAGDAANLRIA
jgi:hypothetical protein